MRPSRCTNILILLIAAHTMTVSSDTLFVGGTAEDCAAGTTTASSSPPNAAATTTTTTTTTPTPPPLSQAASAGARTSPITSEGVELQGHVVVDGTTLVRNGHGKRSITYFGISFRIYVAAMYSSKPIVSAEQVLEATSTPKSTEPKTTTTTTTTTPDQPNESPIDGCPANERQAFDHGPLQLDFTFLRYVRRSQVVSAWKQQLDHSVTFKDYEGYEADKSKFIALASGGPIEYHGTQSIQLVGDETRIIDQGTLKGVIYGRNFQQSFLSMWFGSMAVAEDLKSDLLMGDEHDPEEKMRLEEELLSREPEQVLTAV